jgi:lysozyme
MKISNKGINLIKKWEGFRKTAYKCPSNKNTIGYGHVILPNEKELFELKESITEEFAEELLYSDVKIAENAVNEYVSVPLTQGQFDALVSLVYNWGVSNFSLSNSLKKLNLKNYDEAAFGFFDKEFGVVKSKGNILKGLVLRRQEELDLWKYQEQKTINFVSDNVFKKKKTSKNSFIFYTTIVVSIIIVSTLIIYYLI